MMVLIKQIAIIIGAVTYLCQTGVRRCLGVPSLSIFIRTWLYKIRQRFPFLFLTSIFFHHMSRFHSYRYHRAKMQTLHSRYFIILFAEESSIQYSNRLFNLSLPGQTRNGCLSWVTGLSITFLLCFIMNISISLAFYF